MGILVACGLFLCGHQMDLSTSGLLWMRHHTTQFKARSHTTVVRLARRVSRRLGYRGSPAGNTDPSINTEQQNLRKSPGMRHWMWENEQNQQRLKGHIAKAGLRAQCDNIPHSMLSRRFAGNLSTHFKILWAGLQTLKGGFILRGLGKPNFWTIFW